MIDWKPFTLLFRLGHPLAQPYRIGVGLGKIFTLVCLVLQSFGQDHHSLSIHVQSTDSKPLPGATVRLEDRLRKETPLYSRETNAQGKAWFQHLPKGSYTLHVQYMGYATQQRLVQLPDTQQVIVILQEASRELSEVSVRGKNETQQVREQAIKTAVIDTRPVSSQPATLTELINRASGIRVRQTGGLGSTPDLSVNGFQGRSIRYFKDGIPLDYLGDGYNLSNVPLNVLERLEIYKGVLPTSLGGDALGGAVNLVTRKELGRFLSGSYELASFRTHRLSVNGLYGLGKAYVGADLFFNHSDNDYKALVKVTDPETRNQTEARLRLFHNAFTSAFGEVYGGWKNTSWADDFRLSLAGFQLQRQQQHPALMTDPYGAVLGLQSSLIPSLRYKKSGLDHRLEIDQFLVYNTLRQGRVDTLRGRYDWYGTFMPHAAQRGESRQASLAKVDVTHFTSRTNLRYRISPGFQVELNYVLTSARRQGHDPYGPRFSQTTIDVLSIPTKYQKQVLGLGLENTWGRFTNVLIGKRYAYQSAGVDTWASRPVDQSERISKSDHTWGVAEALKFQLNDQSFTRLSLEAAYRLPQADELFGDAVWVVSNYNLNPETSTNVNWGYRLEKSNRFALETNLFYRRTKGMILLIPIQPPYAQYTNMENVKGYGIEADASYRLFSYLTITGNATYQNLRLFGITTPLDNWKNNSRLRNTPWFFANVGLTSDFSQVVKAKDQLKIYLYYNFMKEYYLETIPKRLESTQLFGLIGQAKVASNLIIPTQHLLSAGLSYGWKQYQLGGEVKNILNTDLYDYYRIQKAGRSFHLKLGFLLHKPSITH